MSNLKTKGKRYSIGASVMILETWKYEKTDIFLICQINLYSFICHTWLNIQKAIKVFRATDLLQGSYKYAHYHLYYLETIENLKLFGGRWSGFKLQWVLI